ncbi:MAG: NAD(P)H-hydrate epimerase [Phycisphaerae bacterium]|nr:NAD(P)H-hydrate epimerase [Phycisphaerae bacterium]
MASLSRDQVRTIDRTAIEVLGIPGVILMENAGRNCADAVEEFIGGTAEKSIVVVSGAGNNGGDGYVVARHLAVRGSRVVTFITCPPEKITGDAAVNLSIIAKLRHDIRQLAGGEIARLGEALKSFDVIVDAVGGTGIRGALRGDAAAAVEQINAAGRPVVAVDIPTGLDCDTGQADGPAVRAKLTVTFLARKKGFDSPAAREFTGQVHVADIGIPSELVAQIAGGGKK